MKKLFGGLFILTVFVACKKEDSIQPVITLNGAPEKTIALNGTYTEEGATASDNEDGDITSSIIISGSVDTDQTGEYRIFYDVSDANGNKASTAIRFVHVINSSEGMVGTYQATPSCGGTQTYNTVVTASETENNVIFINKVLYSVENDPVQAQISGSTITIPFQTMGSSTIEGSGTVSGSTFVMNIVFDSQTFPYTCTIDHVKL